MKHGHRGVSRGFRWFPEHRDGPPQPVLPHTHFTEGQSEVAPRDTRRRGADWGWTQGWHPVVTDPRERFPGRIPPSGPGGRVPRLCTHVPGTQPRGREPRCHRCGHSHVHCIPVRERLLKSLSLSFIICQVGVTQTRWWESEDRGWGQGQLQRLAPQHQPPPPSHAQQPPRPSQPLLEHSDRL